METTCQSCLRSPLLGFAGHDDLNVRRLGDNRMTLQCRLCESFWSRTFKREGYFAWAAITEPMASSPEMGIRVPPRSTDEDYRPLPWHGSGHFPWLAAITRPGAPRT
jgi:hypothetical protein